MTEAKVKIKDVKSKLEGRIIKLLHISGQLDATNVDEKAQEIGAVVMENPLGLCLIFDLEDLEYLNSKAIGLFMKLHETLSTAQGYVVLVNPRENVLDTLNLVGIGQLMPIYASVKEATEALNTPAAEA